MKVFLITIKILSKEWHYNIGQLVIVPVETNNKHNAVQKLRNKFSGSEYPNYDIIDITECDNFIFKPILKKQKK